MRSINGNGQQGSERSPGHQCGNEKVHMRDCGENGIQEIGTGDHKAALAYDRTTGD